MKPLLLTGIVLIVLGLVGLLYGGITYTKHRDHADLGIMDVTVKEKDTLQIHPAIGGAILVAGIVVTGAAMKRRSGGSAGA